MSGTHISRAVLAAAIAAGLAAATPAMAANLEGTGVTDPAIRVVLKIKGQDKPFVRSLGVSAVTYTCADGSTFTAGFTVESLKINDRGGFQFSGESEDGKASLRLSGKVKDNGRRATGSFTETRDVSGSGSCTSDKQKWEAERG